jgi:hypothetical protein
MIWQDIALEGQCDQGTLKSALAAAFDVASDDVCVVDSIEKAASTSIVAVMTSIKGDFRCLLSLYVAEVLADKDPVEVIGRICSILKVKALISDQSANPYSMILINEEAESRPVKLDVESLDQHEEYRLSAGLSDRQP